MRPAVQINCPEGMGTADIEDVDPLELGHLDNLHSVGRQEHPRATGGLAPCVRLELIQPAIGVQRSRPRLEGQILVRGQAERIWNDGTRKPQTLLLPAAAKQRVAVRRTRRRLRSPPWTPVRGSPVARISSVRDADLDAAVSLARLLANERHGRHCNKDEDGAEWDERISHLPAS